MEVNLGNHSSRVTPDQPEFTLFNDLGSFEGFSFRDQQAIERDLSAEEVVNWDHDEDGEAEFWPAGDCPGVQLIFSGASSVCAREIVALEELLHELGGDDVETYARTYAAMSYDGRDMTELTAEELEDLVAPSPCQRSFALAPPPNASCLSSSQKPTSAAIIAANFSLDKLPPCSMLV